jgi:hypothetical protein
LSDTAIIIVPKGDQWRRGQRIAKLVGNTRYQAIIEAGSMVI